MGQLAKIIGLLAMLAAIVIVCGMLWRNHAHRHRSQRRRARGYRSNRIELDATGGDRRDPD